MCTYSRIHRVWIDRKHRSSLTVTLEEVLLTTGLKATKDRNVISIYIPNDGK